MKFQFSIFLFLFSFSLSYVNLNAQKTLNIDSLLTVIENTNDSDKIVQYKKLSWNYRNSEAATALKYGIEAMKIAEKLKDSSQLASTYNFLGVFESKISQYAKALEYYFTALRIAQAIDDKTEIGFAYNNIGEIYAKQNNDEQAFINFKKAIESFEKVENYRGIAYCYSMLGQLYTRKNEFDKALHYFMEAVDIAKKQNDIVAEASRYLLIGHLFYAKQDYISAIEFCVKSLEISNTNNQQMGKADAYLLLGNIYFQKRNYQVAKVYLQKALNIGEQVKSIEIQSNVSLAMSKVLKSLKDYENAFDYLLHHKMLSDSINNSENTKIITQLTMQYNFDKTQKEKEIEQQKKDMLVEAKIKRQRIVGSFIVLGFILVVIFSSLLFRNRQKIKLANNQLTEQNFQINEQKEEILAQRDEIENHLEEVTQQRDQISIQNRQITDSIEYAQRIQSAILPPDEMFTNVFKDHFILFRPKDIVSGDFYWATNKEDFFYFAVADCTGHGVPGAIMSMLGTASLNDIVIRNEAKSANIILEELRKNVKNALRQTGDMEESKDGMDMALCIINKKTKELQFAGANRPAYIFRKQKIEKLSATENPIGIDFREISFESQRIKLVENDKIYLFTDGYADQFGGSEDKKYMIQKLIKLIEENHEKSMIEQKEILSNSLDEWMGHEKPSGGFYKQLDDILVLGVTI